MLNKIFIISISIIIAGVVVGIAIYTRPVLLEERPGVISKIGTIERTTKLALEMFGNRTYLLNIINSPTGDLIWSLGLEGGPFPKRIIFLTQELYLEVGLISRGISTLEFNSSQEASKAEERIRERIETMPEYNITSFPQEKINDASLWIYQLNYTPAPPEEKEEVPPEIFEAPPIYVGVITSKNWVALLTHGEKESISKQALTWIKFFD